MAGIPPLALTGGASAPATSGGIGDQGNIGALTINKGGRSLIIPTLIITGVFVTLKLMKKI